MARPKNADKTKFRTGAEQVETARKAGKASGEARRKKKELRECLEILLEREIKASNGEKMNGAEAISAKLFEKALKGDIKAFEVIRDTTGQKPVEKVEQTSTNIIIDFGEENVD